MTPENDTQRTQRYNGLAQPAPAVTLLRAGPLTLSYQDGDLRRVALGEDEILLRVLVAVRDQHWNTVPNCVFNTHIEQGADWFRITFEAESRRREIDFAWRATLTGDARGTLVYAFEGQARSTFLTNRLGLVVLHPQRAAGAVVREERVDGQVIEAAFPKLIRPVQPFEDIRALAHVVRPGVWAEVRFAGEVFEMEDQRNYTDASFKTYSTPARLPRPRQVPAGTRIAHSVTLTLKGETPAPVAAYAAPELAIGSAPVGRMPRLGLGVASHGQALTPAELERLRALRLSHLRVDVRLGEAGWRERLRQAAAEAGALGVGLELALFLTAEMETELADLRAELDQLRPAVARWLVYCAGEARTSAVGAQQARALLGTYDPAAPLVGGTDMYFIQINGPELPVTELDGVCYSMNPQVHTFDTDSLMENLPGQAATVERAQAIAQGKPIHISPLTLSPRFNPGAASAEPALEPGELPRQVDGRQMLLAGASWLVGSLQALAQSGAVSSLTLFETTGWRGVMETAAGSPLPGAFPSWPGMVFPLYHVLADAGEAKDAEVLPLTSSQPRHVAGLAWRKDGETRVLVANLTEQLQRVSLSGLGPRVRVRYLDEANARLAALEPERFRAEAGQEVVTEVGSLTLALRAYAVARVG